MTKIIVLSHMMKTAGTNFNKQLIHHFGSKMHILPGGLNMDDHYYDLKRLQEDLKKCNNRLSLIAGHPIRPFQDYGELENRLRWATIFRKPLKRYVSHFFHDYEWTESPQFREFRQKRNLTIEKWEELKGFSNYQTRFIAGEENLNKAIDIIETKLDWVGLTEELETSLCSFKQYFDLKGFHFSTSRTNSNLAANDERQRVEKESRAFIEEKNQLDIALYDYIKENVWPRYRVEPVVECGRGGKSKVVRDLNFLSFHINRQLKFRTVDFRLKNIKRFYNRWLRS